MASRVSVLFSEPKISQSEHLQRQSRRITRFSALQRAENFSIAPQTAREIVVSRFQCSSASRKFLNPSRTDAQRPRCTRFSALQRAENFSIRVGRSRPDRAWGVSVLFSEPKISQSQKPRRKRRGFWKVSVLFSEPKISQSKCA